MRATHVLAIIATAFLVGCATPSNRPTGSSYTSPNGGFVYTYPAPDMVDRVKENLAPEGGNVQFYQWSHLKRIDYVRLDPTVEAAIQDRAVREQMLTGFTAGVFIPSIARFVPRAKVVTSGMEEVGGVPVLYVAMLLPGGATKSLDGKRLDACRCFLVHTNGKRAYVFTVSAGIDRRGEETPDEQFEKTRGWLKPMLLEFFADVRIQ